MVQELTHCHNMKLIKKLKDVLDEYFESKTTATIFGLDKDKIDRQLYKDIALPIAELFNDIPEEPYCAFPIECECCLERFMYRRELEKRVLEFLKK